MDDVLRAYLDRLAALKAANDRALGADDLRAIATDLGLTEADLAAVDAAARAAHQRGRGHLAHRRWTDAIAELETAAAIRPTDREVAADLAEAHLGRWQADRQAEDREAARRHARRGLALDPSWQRGFALLNELDAPSAPRRVAVLLAVATMAVALGAAAFVHLRAHAPEPRASAPGAGAAADEAHGGGGTTEAEIPLDLAPGPKAAGLKLVPRLCRRNDYPERSFWKLAAEVRNEGRTELSRLLLEVALLRDDGQALARYTTEVVGSQSAALRPGDQAVFSGIRETTPALRRVRLTVLARDEAPAPASYGTTPSAPLEWAIVRPAGFDLEVRERTLTVQPMTFLKADPIATGQFEVRNKGAAIRRLRLEMALLDPAGKRLGGHDRLVVTGEGMELRPGEARLDKWYVRVPKGFSRYAMRVLAIE